MDRFTIKGKLVLLALSSLAILGLVGATGWFGVVRLGNSLDTVSARMWTANVLTGIRLAQLNSASESVRAEFAKFDALADKGDALQEVNGFYAYALGKKQELHQKAEQSYEAYARLPKTAAEDALWQAFQADWKAHEETTEAFHRHLKLLATLDDWNRVPNELSTLSFQEDDWLHSTRKVADHLDKLLELNHAASEETRKNGELAKATAMGIIGAIVAGAIVGLAALAWLIVRDVVGSLERMRQAIAHVAASDDFTARIAVKGKDEAAQTALAFNVLVAKMQASLHEVLKNAEKISEAAQHTLGAARRMSEASSTQSGEAAAMAAAIEEMTTSIQHIAGSASDARSRARDAGAGAEQGKDIIARSAGEMDLIADSIGHAADTIGELGRQSEQISHVIRVIDDLADQTNLLALNAAIEAARAGEQGRGFAVVADEVRKLAERTTRSTEEITRMVQAMQTSARNAVTGMGSVTAKVSAGKDLSDQAAGRMNGIHADATQVSDAINEISAALHEQGSAAEEVARRVEVVAQMSEGNCNAANETAVIAGDLSGLAGALRASANRFKV
ncbi:methyl-accepting chemotaxis protein [Aromatoleum bremense]|nr:methyl-accepting chemotaxis protein [Aromatoleum bremense]QTQ30224.1 Methyl-accepting chemotaxis protein [Aromatoleum bremense]